MKYRILALVTAALLPASFSSASGQQRPAESEKTKNQGQQPDAALLQGDTKNGAQIIPELVFEGGSIQRLIDKLKQAGLSAGLPPLNVIVQKDIPNDSNIPPLELHHVSYADVFQALNKMRSLGMWEPSGNGRSPADIWVLIGAPFRPVQHVDPLTGMPISSDGPPKSCQIYQLQRYLGKYKVEDITTAIQTAWTMMDHKGAELKYHKDTSLLIAVGQPNQLEVISRVLHSLEKGLAFTATAAKSQPAEVFVNGAVNKPGAIPLSEDQELDVLGVIARAGGLSARASERNIRLSRPGEGEKTFSLSDLKQTPQSVRPGDTIEVREKLF